MRKMTREILVQKQFSRPSRLLVVCGKGSSGGDGTAGCLACWYGERDVHDLVQLFPSIRGFGMRASSSMFSKTRSR